MAEHLPGSVRSLKVLIDLTTLPKCGKFLHLSDRTEPNVDEFIQEGGSVPQVASPQPVEEPTEEEVKGLKMPLPADLLKRVDEVVKSRRPAPSRHQWILEAIYGKLDREASE